MVFILFSNCLQIRFLKVTYNIKILRRLFSCELRENDTKAKRSYGCFVVVIGHWPVLPPHHKVPLHFLKIVCKLSEILNMIFTRNIVFIVHGYKLAGEENLICPNISLFQVLSSKYSSRMCNFQQLKVIGYSCPEF